MNYMDFLNGNKIKSGQTCVWLSLDILKQLIREKINRYFMSKRTVLIIGVDDAVEYMEKFLSMKKGSNLLASLCGNCSMQELKSNFNEAGNVFICPSINGKQRMDIIHDCVWKGKTVFFIPDIYEITLYKSQLVQLDSIPVIRIDSIKLPLLRRVIKRTMDIALAIIGIIMTLPLSVIVSTIIKMSDMGPVLYLQDRITRGNKLFKMYKFRTMVLNAEEGTGPVLAVENDVRITRIGRFLRSTRIDELPQLINVLKGEMSIVGPRPERPQFTKIYEASIPNYIYRTSIKAGLTGIAQVYGKYSTNTEDKLKYDLYYLKNQSILLDLKIIIKTIKVIFMNEKAKGISCAESNMAAIRHGGGK